MSALSGTRNGGSSVVESAASPGCATVRVRRAAASMLSRNRSARRQAPAVTAVGVRCVEDAVVDDCGAGGLVADLD